MEPARSRLVTAAHKVNYDRFQHQSRLDELYLAAIAFAESIGYEKEEEPIPANRTYDLIDAFSNGNHLWQCRACGRQIVGNRQNNMPDHDCAEPGHWTTPPYRKPIDWTRP